MEILGQFLVICAVWCFSDQVHSLPTNTNIGLSSVGLPVTPSSLNGGLRECGKSKKTVVNTFPNTYDKYALLGDWPWMVALYIKSVDPAYFDLHCGGSLISKQWIISAAHCVVDVCAQNMFAQLGDLDLDDELNDGASPLWAEVDLLVPHPRYLLDTNNDIALIRMKNPVHFTDNIRPICLLSGEEYTANEYYDGKQPLIIKWGQLVNDEQVNFYDRLKETSVMVVAPEKCTQQYSEVSDSVIDEKIICAEGYDESVCQGDSGGPLMFYNNTENRFYLGGITSGGEGCTERVYPGLYTKVAQFTTWVTSVTGQNF